MVACLDHLATPAILGGMLLGLADHALDILLGQPAGCLDADLLFFAGRLVAGRDVDDAVGIDVECHFDLCRAARRRRDADKIELPQQLVVCRKLAFPLKNANGDSRLVVFRRGERLAAPRRNRGVALDQLGHHATERLDAK